MKKLLTILIFFTALNAGAQNIFRAPSQFWAWADFSARITQHDGTDTGGLQTIDTNTTLYHGMGFVNVNPQGASMGNGLSNGYRVIANSQQIYLQKNGVDTITFNFSGDTAHVVGTVSAWDFSPPLPGGGGSGWNLTGNAGTNPATNFLGTTDSVGLLIKADNKTEEGIGYGIKIAGSSKFGYDAVNVEGYSSGGVGVTIVGHSTETGIGAVIISANNDGNNNHVLINSAVKIVDGTEGAGKVLTSDANGLATWQPAINGDSTIAWSLTGNSGTNPATNFIGTTDNQNLRIVSGGGSISLNTANKIRFKDTSDNIIMQFDNEIKEITSYYDSVTLNGKVRIVDGTQGAGKVLTSDANGLASWQGGIIYDSLTALTGQTITLTNNSTHIIAASGTVISVTWTFPTGETGDVLDIENMQIITTLNITGTGTGTITAAKITNTKTAGLKTFHNYGGNWY